MNLLYSICFSIPVHYMLRNRDSIFILTTIKRSKLERKIPSIEKWNAVTMLRPIVDDSVESTFVLSLGPAVE